MYMEIKLFVYLYIELQICRRAANVRFALSSSALRDRSHKGVTALCKHARYALLMQATRKSGKKIESHRTILTRDSQAPGSLVPSSCKSLDTSGVGAQADSLLEAPCSTIRRTRERFPTFTSTRRGVTGGIVE